MIRLKTKIITRPETLAAEADAARAFDFSNWVRFDSFYQTRIWFSLRESILTCYGRSCMECGNLNCIIQVDHVRPRSYYPEDAIDPRNLQVLCIWCNKRKSNLNTNDFRTSEEIVTHEATMRTLADFYANWAKEPSAWEIAPRVKVRRSS